MIGLYPRRLRMVVADASGEGLDLGQLSARFEVSKQAQNGINLARIVVFNLSDETISDLSGKYTTVELQAGHAQRVGSIFKGQIRNVFPTLRGPNRVVEIFAGAGARAFENARVNLSFKAGTSLHSVIKALASTFEGIQPGRLSGLTDRVLPGARIENGMTRDALNQLAESFGFRWSIDGGVFQAIDEGRPSGAGVVEVSRETGMIGSPLASTTGVEVTTLLNPAVLPGRQIHIKTAGARAAASLTALTAGGTQLVGVDGGIFTVFSVHHIGETRGQAWYSRIQTLSQGRA